VKKVDFDGVQQELESEKRVVNYVDNDLKNVELLVSIHLNQRVR
jgi:hypothetical protein